MSDTKKPAQIVKKVPNAELYDDGTILIRGVRFSYPHVFEPWAKDPEKEVRKYGVVGLMPKKTHAEVRALLVEHGNKLLKESKVEVSADHKFYRNGEDEEGKPKKPGYEGCWSVSSTETKKPFVLGRNGKSLNPEKDKDVIYGGCWGNILIRPWVQNNKHGKRLNAGFVGCQFVRDDEPFGEGGVDQEEASSRFGAEEGDDGYSDGLGNRGGDADDI